VSIREAHPSRRLLPLWTIDHPSGYEGFPSCLDSERFLLDLPCLLAPRRLIKLFCNSHLYFAAVSPKDDAPGFFIELDIKSTSFTFNTQRV
jgi:hypothetical protein